MRFLFFLSFLVISLSASHIRWFGDFELAHKEAIKEHKHLMVLLFEKNNSTCQDLIKTTFTNRLYIDEINENYISVVVMKGQKESYPIEMLYTLAYPALFFLDNEELFVCAPLIGDITPERLKNHLEQCK